MAMVKGAKQNCLKWSEAGIPRYESVGDHNYCRNPDKINKQDWCFVQRGKMGSCLVDTCGKCLVDTCGKCLVDTCVKCLVET